MGARSYLPVGMGSHPVGPRSSGTIGTPKTNLDMGPGPHIGTDDGGDFC